MKDTVKLWGVFGRYGLQEDGSWWSSALLEIRNTKEEAQQTLEELSSIENRWDKLEISVIEVDRSRIHLP